MILEDDLQMLEDDQKMIEDDQKMMEDDHKMMEDDQKMMEDDQQRMEDDFQAIHKRNAFNHFSCKPRANYSMKQYLIKWVETPSAASLCPERTTPSCVPSSSLAIPSIYYYPGHCCTGGCLSLSLSPASTSPESHLDQHL